MGFCLCVISDKMSPNWCNKHNGEVQKRIFPLPFTYFEEFSHNVCFRCWPSLLFIANYKKVIRLLTSG